MPLMQKEEEIAGEQKAEETRKKLGALTPVKVKQQAEEGYGEAQKNAKSTFERALSFFSVAEDRKFHDFLRQSEINQIIQGGKKSFENAKVEFAYTGEEDRKQIYSVKVTMNGEPPKTLTLTTANNSVQLLLTDQNNTPLEHIMQKDNSLRYSKLSA